MLVWGYPHLRPALAEWPEWLLRLVDLAILSAPLVAAVVLAARLASTGFARATGVRRWVGTDLVFGIGIALVVRAIAELVPQTAAWQQRPGSLAGSALAMTDASTAVSAAVASAIAMAGVIVVTPLVEEFFFRGLLQRSLAQRLGATGRIVAPVVAILVTTAVFAWLHMINAAPSPPLLVGTIGIGLGAGILTAVTGRLGGAIAAHIVNNAVVVLLPLF